ncbi:MAG: hypothetical protein R3C62_05495 [Chloroflexota bacterium]
MLDAQFYNLIQSLWGGFAQAMRRHGATPPSSPSVLLQLRGGLAESPGWFMVQAAEFDPEPLTVAGLRVRDIYAAERMVQALLDLMLSEMWLDLTDEGYMLTEQGREVLGRMGERTAVLSQLTLPIAERDAAWLEQTMRQLLEASLQADAPPGTWCLTHSRRRAPADTATNAEKIFQYVADFNAFRDDAHMAAWGGYEVMGYAWEAFALVCGGKGKTAVSIHQQIAYRGYTRDEYAHALAQLHARGWLEQERPGSYFVTPAGQAVWDDVEHLTNSYFYKPWQTLSEKEIAKLETLLTQLRDGLLAEQ